MKHKIGLCASDDCEYCGGPHQNAEKPRPPPPAGQQQYNAYNSQQMPAVEEDWNDEGLAHWEKWEKNFDKQWITLCDNGSQVNLISSAVAQQLDEKPSGNELTFYGIGGFRFPDLINQ